MAGLSHSYADRFGALKSATNALLADAYLSLTARPVRTTAMVAGIVLGVASSTAAVLIADTQRVRIDKQFDAQRSRFVVLQANGETSRVFPVTRVREIARLGPVSAAGEFSIWNDSMPVSTNAFTEPQRTPLLAATTSGLRASQTYGVAGLGLSAVDRLPASVVWLGRTLAARLGVRMDRPQTVSVAGRVYTVAGIAGNDSGFAYVNASVIMSSTLARAHYGPGATVRFLAHVRPGSARPVADYALAALDPTQQQRLGDVTAPDGQILVGRVSSDLRRIGLALGVLVGLIGMVAVANTLSMAVAQRSRELGLRAAMGWTPRRIGGLVLVESGIAGLVAAVIGCGLGLLAAFLWCLLQGWELIVLPTLGPLVVVAGTVSSLLGGMIPARRAASISPLEAMRS
jgi:putative ABC transport system permease protein